jgi:hypothetical protein
MTRLQASSPIKTKNQTEWYRSNTCIFSRNEKRSDGIRPASCTAASRWGKSVPIMAINAIRRRRAMASQTDEKKDRIADFFLLKRFSPECEVYAL